MQNVGTPPPRNFHFQTPEPPRAVPAMDPPSAGAPLLPPVLAGPAAFVWLWVLPIAILLALNVEGYALIEGNMSDAQRSSAQLFGLANAANLLAGIALFFTARSFATRGVSPAANLILRTAPALLIQVAYLWFAITSTSAIPASVTAWIYPESRYWFNQFSFAMVPLFVGILHLACAQRGGGATKAIVVNAGVAVAAPAALFLLAHGARQVHQVFEFSAIVWALIVIALAVAMFVGLVRVLMLGLRRIQQAGSAFAEWVAIVLVALVLPLGGLLLNRSIEFPVDFQAWEVYALTVANAAILLYASARATRFPRLSFALLCALFPFSLYFFIVFLPYTPLSIFAVVLFGAGFLVLTPALLFALHLYLLNRAHHALRPVYTRWQIVATGALCFLMLPMSFVGRAAADKAALNRALQHVYAPAITGRDIVYGRSTTELRRALSSHRSYKNGIYYPLLSDFYAWWVFDHLVLPDDKLARLEETFFGVAGANTSHDLFSSPHRNARQRGSSVRAQSRMPRPAQQLPHQVLVENLAVQGRAADASGTVLTCALELHNPGPAADEYVKVLPLPPGVFVSGFRLWVNGEPVPGRIFEKKTALWVYTMIRDTQRRDPGVIFYNTPDELELRVFPVGANSSTHVEIDFLVPGALAAADQPVQSRDVALVLAEAGRRAASQLTADPGGTLVSLNAGHRAGLPVVEREPYLHVIVDRSSARRYLGDLRRAMGLLRKEFPAARYARVTLANYDVVDLVRDLTPLEELASRDFGEWQRTLPEGGALALDLAAAHAIRRHRDDDLDRSGSAGAVPLRPILVVLSQDAAPSVAQLSLTEHWLDLVPGLEIHALTAGGTHTVLRGVENTAAPLLKLGQSLRPLAGTRAVRFAPAGKDSALMNWSPGERDWQPVGQVTLQGSSTAWARAMSLAAAQQDYARSPGDAATDLPALVRASRETGILLGGSSYIVVENAAQWRMLERGEKQKLGQQAALDFLETPAPPAVYIGAAFIGWMIVRRWRSRRAAMLYR